MSILIISSLLLLLLWPACYALLRYSERYTLNRFLLVVAMVAVCALPFVSLESPAPVITQSLQGTIAYVEQTVTPLRAFPSTSLSADLLVASPVVTPGSEAVAEAINMSEAGTIYLFGLGLALLLLTVRLLFILALHLRSRPAIDGGYRLLHPTASQGQAFTFGPHVYFSEDVAGGADFDHALAHERIHACQAHSVDIVLSELFLCVFWFHPAAWWLRAQLRANLEYLVDRAVLQSGADKRNYQLALVRQSQGMHGLALALPFSEPSLKGRIERMTGLPRYKMIGLLAAVVLTLWMGVASMLVNGSPAETAGLIGTPNEASFAVPSFDELQEIYTQTDVAGIKSFELYFRRLPTPYEFAQIQQMLGVLKNTRLSIYRPCNAMEGEYTLQLSHWLNAEAQLPFYLREGELLENHHVLKLESNSMMGGVRATPHVAAGYFSPVLRPTVLDEKEPFEWRNRAGNKISTEGSTIEQLTITEGDYTVRLDDYRSEISSEEIAVFINGERKLLTSRPPARVVVDGNTIEADRILVKIDGHSHPVPNWRKGFFATWSEVVAENGSPHLPANVRMSCLLGTTNHRWDQTHNVRYGYTGSSRVWFERMRLPEGRETVYYLNDEISTAAEVLDREFEIVDMQVGYDRNDPNGAIIVQAIDDLY